MRKKTVISKMRKILSTRKERMQMSLKMMRMNLMKTINLKRREN
jgi:hypothetical protein